MFRDDDESKFKQFCRVIDTYSVIVRCGADLDRQAEELLDTFAKHHQADAPLRDGDIVEYNGIPFTLQCIDDSLVVHGPDIKTMGVPASLRGADQCLRILYEQEAVVRRIGAEPVYAPFHAAVTFDRRALREVRVCLYRTEPNESRDSGWRIEPVLRDTAAPTENVFTTMVAEIYRTRPWFGKVLALPPGYRAVVDSAIESIEIQGGDNVWLTDPLALARLAHTALKKGRWADLERFVNSLLDSTKTDIPSLRPIRRLARRWSGGPWLAYANALTALARQESDENVAAQMRLIVDAFRNELSTGGALFGEPAPIAIIENVIVLYHAFEREKAAEVLEGLLAITSKQQASLLFLRAALAKDDGRVAESLRHAVEVEPNSASMWYFLSNSVLHEAHTGQAGPDLNDRLDEVIAACDRAMALIDARITSDVDHCIRAMAHFLMNCNWTLADIICNRTIALREQGRLEDALASANSLVSAAPEEPRWWGVLGTVLAARGCHEDAIRAYDKAIHFSKAPPPDALPLFILLFVSPWYERAALHALVGRRDAAIGDLRHAVALAPTWAKNAIVDDRFQGLAADNEFQRIVQEGQVAAEAWEKANSTF